MGFFQGQHQMIASYYTHTHYEAILLVSVWCNHKASHVLGVRNRIIKLYFMSQRLLRTMKDTYLVTHICNNFQTQDEAENNVVGGTIYKQGPQKWRSAYMYPTFVYFEKNHSQECCLLGVTITETQ